MNPPHHSPDQSTILQRCKSIIESLQDEIQQLSTRISLLELENSNLLNTISSKTKTINELQLKIESVRTMESMEDNLSTNSLGFKLYEGNWRSERGKIRTERNRDDWEQNQNQVMGSKYGESYSRTGNLNDLLAADKSTILQHLKIKDQQLKLIRNENQKIKQEYIKISKHCKQIIDKIVSEYKIESSLISGNQLFSKKGGTVRNTQKAKKQQRSTISNRSGLSKGLESKSISSKSKSKITNKKLDKQSKQLRSYTLNDEYNHSDIIKQKQKVKQKEREYYALK